ncbi:PREDICTED: clathrin interactor EPSIN 2 isoform X1 [Lupinus angustifolius]|uniref:clathrin interactor EPSIN 2 isoform X1 n=1 Tax=Lupinus angustifolius TaxID=3871 RepID=UPI00092ECEC3|nr:PREDICTED: clathrin interactor EPSIN 2 isoform X1 [Lupinus angustifolius]
MKKVIGQTVRDLKRGVNKKVLKVPGIEQKVLDATSNEPWGPHGTLLADIAQATRNPHEYQMIMAVIWKRINDTGKNWRHVYKALTVLEYLVANGSERVIDEIREHAYQISTLSEFQYIDSSGRDQGNNVRRKSQSLVLLVNDKERIIEVRQKAAANRDKFRNNPSDGMYRPGSYSNSAYGDRYDDDRYGNREEDRNGHGYGREREGGYRDDDRSSRDGDRYSRDYEERYGRDGYRDEDTRGRSQSVDYKNESRSRSSDRDRDRSYEDDGHSSRGSNAKPDDRSLEARLERKISEQSIGAPPSYEEAVGESRSPVHSERDVETSAGSAPRGSSPHANDNPSQTAAPTGSSPSVSNNPIEATAASSAAYGNQEIAPPDDYFDPRVPPAAAPAISNNVALAMSNNVAPATSSNVEMDLLGSLSDSFALALVPTTSATETPEGNTDTVSTASFAAPPAGSSNFNQSFEDPFGDSPFKAVPSAETAPSQPQAYQSFEPSQSSAHNANFGFGDSFSVVYSASGAGDTQPFSTNSQFLSQDLSSSQQETDILADILPPAPLPGMASQNISAPAGSQASPSYLASSGQMATPFSEPTGELTQQSFSPATSQSVQQGFSAPAGQFPQQAFSAAPNGQPGQVQSPFSAPNGQLGQVQSPFPAPTSQHGQQTFSSHAGQPNLHGFSLSTGQSVQPPFASQGGQLAQSSGHMYGGFNSQGGSPGAPNMSSQSQNGYNGHMNSGNFQPQAPTGQPSQSTNFPHHGGSPSHTTFPVASHSPTNQASQFNNQSFIGQQGNAAPFSSPFTHQPLAPNASQIAASMGSNSLVSQPSKDKFETKSTIWTDTLSRGLVNLNISGPKTNPLADIGIDFDSINRKEKRMEKPTIQAVTSTITMGKAMGSGSGIGRAGAGAIRPPPNPVMGSNMGMGNGMGMSMGTNNGMGMGMGGYGGMNPSMGMQMGMNNMGMGQGVQMQPPTGGYHQGSNMPNNYNPAMGPGGYSQQPYGGYR